MTENKIRVNDPCPCGSGKKYKKCCMNKKLRENSIFVGFTEPHHNLHYDHEKMEFSGINPNKGLTKPDNIYSQTSYIGDTGKPRDISRIQDKAIPNKLELMRYLSSNFDLIVAVDTNTWDIGSEKISVTGIVHCFVQPVTKPGGYYGESPWHGASLFRNFPSELIPEKYGWMISTQVGNQMLSDKSKRFALVSDHDIDNHKLYNERKIPILGEFYLPENFTLIYGSDRSNDNLLNSLVRECDKQSKDVLKMIGETGYYQYENKKISIDQIPIPTL